MGLIKVAATAGDLDLTFGTNGKVTTDFRDGLPDQAIGDGNAHHAMVCSFITSREYQERTRA